MRADRDDLTAQQQALKDALTQLGAALDDLAAESTRAARAARTKRGNPDLDAVDAAHRAVGRAREQVDFAAYDLQTAAGADG